MDTSQMKELLLQTLETELGGMRVCTTALECTASPRLQREWQARREETGSRAARLRQVCAGLGIDSNAESLGRSIMRYLGESLERAMRIAIESGDIRVAQLVATDCVLVVTMKGQQNWELIGEVAKAIDGAAGRLLGAAYASVEEQHDRRFYHTRARQLWVEVLGMCMGTRVANEAVVPAVAAP